MNKSASCRRLKDCSVWFLVGAIITSPTERNLSAWNPNTLVVSQKAIYKRLLPSASVCQQDNAILKLDSNQESPRDLIEFLVMLSFQGALPVVINAARSFE